ncbi:acyl-coenzyme A:6-aminopenicillanic acid acyl-transferase [Anopheles sinensis]|uniref:Acyl-coenzyme A:6-aminopenicillanic acid acyl-transferase n=1 Tax=Anopheles sinensis TaxID=74873 RepID=A0A084W1E2_ANOSI|nr:acyl-coenzyme A:6-aminopenicillanic acid acyl-transferase [Anopheles sinensis]
MNQFLTPNIVHQTPTEVEAWRLKESLGTASVLERAQLWHPCHPRCLQLDLGKREGEWKLALEFRNRAPAIRTPCGIERWQNQQTGVIFVIGFESIYYLAFEGAQPQGRG